MLARRIKDLLQQYYAAVLATSFAAIAEMAGGPLPNSPSIIASVTLFGTSLLLALFFYMQLYLSDDFDCLPVIPFWRRSCWEQKYNTILFIILFICHQLGLMTMLLYFSTWAAFLPCIGMIAVLINLWGWKRMRRRRAIGPSEPASPD